MAYMNLKAEFVKRGIVQREVAQFLGMSPNNFNLKLCEKVSFTVNEVKRIRDQFVPDASLDYLLESDDDAPTKRDNPHDYAEALTKDGAGPDSKVDDIVQKFHDCANAAHSKH